MTTCRCLLRLQDILASYRQSSQNNSIQWKPGRSLLFYIFLNTILRLLNNPKSSDFPRSSCNIHTIFCHHLLQNTTLYLTPSLYLFSVEPNKISLLLFRTMHLYYLLSFSLLDYILYQFHYEWNFLFIPTDKKKDYYGRTRQRQGA